MMMQFLELFGQWGRGGGYGSGSGPGGMMGGGWYGMGLFGILFQIIFLILIIVGIVVLIKWVSTMSKGGPQQGGPQEDSALEILRRRYARGDITKEEFEEKKKDLS